MTTDEISHTPPSVSYKTFNSLINELLLIFPTRIDLSYLSDKFSINTGTQLINAMRFLKLINGGNRPTPRLKLLVSGTTGEHRAILLRQVADDAYAFVLRGTLAQNSTYNELEDIFLSTYGMDGNVCRKCIKFFLEFSKEAGIPLSPHEKAKYLLQRRTARRVLKSMCSRVNGRWLVTIGRWGDLIWLGYLQLHEEFPKLRSPLTLMPMVL